MVAPGLVMLPDPADRGSVGELVTSTEQALRDAGRLDTYLGQSALDIARRIDQNPAAQLSQAAAAHRELRTVMAEALRGANQVKSAVQARRDELAERRRKAQ